MPGKDDYAPFANERSAIPYDPISEIAASSMLEYKQKSGSA